MSVITISRQLGSRGNEIAGLVCDRLGYRYFDKTLMAQLRGQSGPATGALNDLTDGDRGVGNILDRFFSSFQPQPGDIAAATYGAKSDTGESLPVELVQKLILAAYQQGNVVIVGRGGQAVLHDKEDVLHVRVTAPYDLRLKWVREREGVTEDVAHGLLQRSDREATDYVRQVHGIDPGDPTLYDLVVNTARVRPPVAADLIIRALDAAARSEVARVERGCELSAAGG